MRPIAFIFVLLFESLCTAQTNDKKDPPTLERLCGKLVHSQLVPVKNQLNAVGDKTKNLPGISMRLYRSEGDRPCCEGLQLVAETKTGHWGAFHLDRKVLAPGLYWVIVNCPESEFRVLIHYTPKKDSTELCGDRFFEVDDAGNLRISEMIYVE
jgi:hypothetical protein